MPTGLPSAGDRVPRSAQLADQAGDPADPRSIVVNVAGEAALLVAKLHKLGDRLNEPHRLEAKDAGDVYRLFDNITPNELASRLQLLLNDERSTEVTAAAFTYGDTLFSAITSPGVQLGVDALRATIPAATVTAVLTAYWSALQAALKA